MTDDACSKLGLINTLALHAPCSSPPVQPRPTTISRLEPLPRRFHKSNNYLFPKRKTNLTSTPLILRLHRKITHHLTSKQKHKQYPQLHGRFQNHSLQQSRYRAAAIKHITELFPMSPWSPNLQAARERGPKHHSEYQLTRE